MIFSPLIDILLKLHYTKFPIFARLALPVNCHVNLHVIPFEGRFRGPLPVEYELNTQILGYKVLASPLIDSPIITALYKIPYDECNNYYNVRGSKIFNSSPI